MAVPISVSMPPEITVGDGYVLRWRAVSPTDGSDVSGVVISKVTVQSVDEAAGASAITPGPFMLVPGPGA